MRIRRDRRDAVFSLLVRERAEWRCERCGASSTGRQLHCSHVYSRRYRATRWHPANAFALCFGCHQWLGEHPIEFAGWVESQIGEKRLAEIGRLSQVVARFRKAELDGILADLEDAHGMMLVQRERGRLGRIDFTVPKAVQEIERGLPETEAA